MDWLGRNEPVLRAASFSQDSRSTRWARMTSHRETKTRWQTGAVVRGPQEETYPWGARGWVDSAQAAMETEPAGAVPHCCFDHLFPLGCSRKSEEARHMRSEEGFYVWGWKKSNVWEFDDLHQWFALWEIIIRRMSISIFSRNMWHDLKEQINSLLRVRWPVNSTGSTDNWSRLRKGHTSVFAQIAQSKIEHVPYWALQVLA